jgi:two-component system, NtrC family, sensor kinase
MQPNLRHMLSVRLFALIITVMALGLSFYAYHSVQTHTQHLQEFVYQSADRASDIIRRSTRFGMMLNRSEDIYQIIHTIGTEPGVDGIRIYNKKGVITHSTISAEIGTVVDLRAEACYSCHSEKEPLSALSMQERRRIYHGTDGHRILGLINPIVNEPECYNAACHAHDPHQKILGVLDVKMSLATVDAQLVASRRDMIFFVPLMIMAVAVVSGLFIYIYVRRRIFQLILGTRAVAAGDLDYRISVSGADEIGQLAASFNHMTADLKRAHQEITEWSLNLENKVRQKTQELADAQTHIIRMERLASLGKLSATVAHEINNPLAGVLSYTYLVIRLLKQEQLSEEKKKSVLEYLEFIKNETSRSGDIVKNMLIFAKQTGGNFAREYLSALVESSLRLIQHQCQLKSIQVDNLRECTDDLLMCDAGQIRQALVALFVNAIEAMPDGGRLTVRISDQDSPEQLCLDITDTGVGIPQEIRANIFDPFFSTKKEGKGVGLGLSVVFGIVQRHKGVITVDSELGQGTTIKIDLPRNPLLDSDIAITQQTIAEM